MNIKLFITLPKFIVNVKTKRPCFRFLAPFTVWKDIQKHLLRRIPEDLLLFIAGTPKYSPFFFCWACNSISLNECRQNVTLSYWIRLHFGSAERYTGRPILLRFVLMLHFWEDAWSRRTHNAGDAGLRRPVPMFPSPYRSCRIHFSADPGVTGGVIALIPVRYLTTNLIFGFILLASATISPENSLICDCRNSAQLRFPLASMHISHL